jgi:hypothetical protein
MSARRGGLLLLAVAAAAAAVVGAAVAVPGPPARPAAPSAEQVPVTSTRLGCTGAVGGGSVLATTTDVPGSTGASEVRTVGGDDRVVVEGSGQDAVGLAAWRRSQDAAALCPAPATDWWFAGAGGGLDHRTVLVLTNLDEGPAVVDVDLVGATGKVDDQLLRDLTVQAGSDRVLRLVDVAPTSDELTVHVTTSQGRVVAEAYDTVRTVEGRTVGVGHEWLPPAVAPSTDVRLAAVPAAADRRTLLVTNPGDRQALVTTQVVTAEGAFVPQGAEEVSVDPGEVATVRLGPGFDGRLAALRLRSDVPVTGTVRSQVGEDVAYAGAAATAEGFLVAPAAVAAGGRAVLVLQGTDEPTGAEASVWSSDGRRLAARGLSVAPTGLATWTLPVGAAYVLVEPDTGRGDLAAAVVWTGPGGITSVPLGPVPTTETQPVVTLRTE